MSESTEQQMLEMAEGFKNIVEKKNEEILQMKKNTMLLYGLVRATDENFSDIILLDLIRSYLSTFVEEFLEK